MPGSDRSDELASRLDTLIEALPDAVFFKDGEGRWRVVNSAGLRLFRLAGGDWLGRTDLELAAANPHLAEAFRACHDSDEAAWSGGVRTTLTEAVADPDSGSLRSFEVTKVPLFHADGRRRGLVVVGRDVTEHERLAHRLRQSELQLQAIIENEPECVKMLSEDGTLLKMNRAGLAMIGAESAEQVLGTAVVDLIKPEYRQRFNALTRQVFEGIPGRLEFEMCSLQGTTRWLETNAVPLVDPAGQIVSLLSVTRDISEHKQAEAALRESERRFRDTLEHAPIGMSISALDGRIILANRALCRLLGYDKARLEQMTFRDYTHPDDLPRTLADRERLLAGEIESYHSEKRYLHRNGQVVWVQVTVSALRDGEGRPLNVIAQIEDVSERKRDREQIHRLAYYDTLTNLPNRRLLTDRFNQALAQARRYRRALAVMFLDLDGFKEVNDRCGHDIGDELLKEVAARLRLCVRSGDTVARQGGDEFIVLLSEIGRQQDAERVANKILAALAAPVTVAAHRLQVTTSIGIAVLPEGGDESVTELMKKADMAMYAAKEAGRNRYRLCQCPAGFTSTRCVSVG